MPSPSTTANHLGRLGIQCSSNVLDDSEGMTGFATRWVLLMVALAADTLHALDGLIYHVRTPGTDGPNRPRRLLRWALNHFNTFEMAHLGRILRSRWVVNSIILQGRLIQWATPPAAHHGRLEGKTVLSQAVEQVQKCRKQRKQGGKAQQAVGEPTATILLPFAAPFPEPDEPGYEYFTSQAFLERILDEY